MMREHELERAKYEYMRRMQADMGRQMMMQAMPSMQLSEADLAAVKKMADQQSSNKLLLLLENNA